MSKQINQYTKTRTSGTVTDDDYLDLDSTEDSGSTFESAKMTMLNFVNYLKTKILSFYTNNGTLTGERLVTMASNDVIFHDGNIYVKSELSDNGFLLRDSSDVLKGGMTYDVSAASAGLALINSGGVYFEAIDGKVGINALPVPGYDLNVGGRIQVGERVDFALSGVKKFEFGLDAGDPTVLRIFSLAIFKNILQVKLTTGTFVFGTGDSVLGNSSAYKVVCVSDKTDGKALSLERQTLTLTDSVSMVFTMRNSATGPQNYGEIECVLDANTVAGVAEEGSLHFKTKGVGTAAPVTKMTLRSDGTLNLPTIQTGDAGLVAGDTYMDTAANILANGDLLMAVKQ